MTRIIQPQFVLQGLRVEFRTCVWDQNLFTVWPGYIDPSYIDILGIVIKGRVHQSHVHSIIWPSYMNNLVIAIKKLYTFDRYNQVRLYNDFSKDRIALSAYRYDKLPRHLRFSLSQSLCV